MRSDWKKFIRKVVFEVVVFFVIFCILRWLLGWKMDYIEIALIAIINGLVIGPVTDKLLKDKN